MIANLARVISERDASKGLRRTLLTQARRLEGLASQRAKNSGLRVRPRHDSERERLLVSPTGSKMQAVAVGLFRAIQGDIQIVYPTPKEFRAHDDYTRGVRQLYSLPLSVFASVMAS